MGLLLNISQGDKKSIRDLLVMLNPLFREIPGAVEIGTFAWNLMNKDKKKILKGLPNLINILLLTLIHKKLVSKIKNEKGIESIKLSSQEILESQKDSKIHKSISITEDKD